ncbi:hypothetical protein [Photobacterium indicum]|uniref:hypothetical protein n=1 Tax=Photobacterium indicum TaxID=81447 RepID=UPI003D0E454D
MRLLEIRTALDASKDKEERTALRNLKKGTKVQRKVCKQGHQFYYSSGKCVCCTYFKNRDRTAEYQAEIYHKARPQWRGDKFAINCVMRCGSPLTLGTREQYEELKGLIDLLKVLNGNKGQAKWTLDHVIPLAGMTLKDKTKVYGMTVFDNLQIIEIEENQKKTFTVDIALNPMPEMYFIKEEYMQLSNVSEARTAVREVNGFTTTSKQVKDFDPELATMTPVQAVESIAPVNRATVLFNWLELAMERSRANTRKHNTNKDLIELEAQHKQVNVYHSFSYGYDVEVTEVEYEEYRSALLENIAKYQRKQDVEDIGRLGSVVRYDDLGQYDFIVKHYGVDMANRDKMVSSRDELINKLEQRKKENDTFYQSIGYKDAAEGEYEIDQSIFGCNKQNRRPVSFIM